MFIIRLCRVVAEKMPHVLKRIFEVFHKIFSYTPSVIPDIYMSVKFLAECKKFQKNNKISALGSVCRKFTHFPSVKFPGLEICECKKNDKYQVWGHNDTRDVILLILNFVCYVQQYNS